jgi:outer membrane protein assembly factor BamD
MTWRIPRTLCLAALCACAGGGKDAGIDLTKPVTGAEASNAAIAYNKALQEKKSENFVEATRLFEYVRTNFPYSQYSAMAELGVADMSFDREDWGAAATQFQDFVKSHPSHPKADYAAYRAGVAYFQDRPSDFFLLPPSYEKDQGPIRQALEALNRFVNGYPKSEYIPKAKALISDCRELLAAHERYVAEFYVKNDQWKGAAQRYMTLADTYGDLRDGTMHGESLWNAANAWQKANDPGDERAVLRRLVQEAPRSPHLKAAEQRLAQVPAAAPATPPKAEKPAAGEAPPAQAPPAQSPPGQAPQTPATETPQSPPAPPPLKPALTPPGG